MAVIRLVCVLFTRLCLLPGADLPSIEVWIKDDVSTRGILELHLSLAGTLFGEIGVKIHWRIVEPDQDPPADAPFTVQVARYASDGCTPDALASTYLPGADITIFADRIHRRLESAHPSVRRKMLGYVIAHELAHAIQGISRHSEDGIMKAFWSNVDFAAMLFDEFKFSHFDATLIRQRAALPRTRRQSAPPAGYE